MAQTLHITVRTRPMNLDGNFVYESLYTAECETSIRTMRVVYDEGTSADAGVEIRVGKIGDADYFATFTTESSKSAGDATNLEKTFLTLMPHETLTVECDCGKIGAGVISVQIECNYNVTL